MLDSDIVIAGAARTPIGSLLGALASESAPALGSVAIAEAIRRAGLAPADIDEVLMGQVLQGGVGQSPARQASLAAGIPHRAPCTTVNKVCGSGLKAVMMARQSIRLGEAVCVVAGGMESMTNSPHLLKARGGFRMGDAQLVDSMIVDGLWDPFGDKHMGSLGELCAAEHNISREQQDVFATRSYEAAQKAQSDGRLAEEITPVTISSRRRKVVVDVDEEPSNYRPEKVPDLRPVFDSAGTITAANASKISDGAAALVITSRVEAERRGLSVLASIVADATFAQDPDWFTTAPIGAIRAAAARAEMEVGAIDLFEINEAFAVVALAAIKELDLDIERVNVHGGAVSLGHPIGCSGARILVTLLYALKSMDLNIGCASLCLGGGEAVAMIIRREDESAGR